ncbi:hypothetical protein [Mangrovicoccus algicola]|uniref:Uncharacterized protein n=1 Tax=Mangrovicoccus algicola TaxID=2771008 RepID=A0A8J6YW93_9RHOB|nr:hypothetical protein [Mangrovicoccus algicola]MBE3637208.1 hypothetical protein [Mangrovicoccus algicola]
MTFDEAVSAALEFILATELTSEPDRLASLALHFARIGDNNSLDVMVTASRDQRLAYDALSIASAQLLIEEGSLPYPLAEFVAHALTAPASRPVTPEKFRKEWPGGTVERDIMVFDAVKMLCASGLKASRNESSPPLSACDAVASAGKLSGKCPGTYSAIWKIYSDVNKREKNGVSQRLPLAIHRLALS